jgi:energy-coupling factor transport system ATP-binding protein
LVYTLSGGEKRKVALASVLALDPSILLLDEPTAGLDPAAHRDLLTRLAEFQSGGKTLVISSHQMEDLAVLAQGLTVFQNGLTIANGSPVDIFNDPVLLEVAGLEAPLAARIAGWLRSRGWPLAAGSVTIESLEAGLAGLVGGNHE